MSASTSSSEQALRLERRRAHPRTPPGCGRALSFRKYSRRRRMRCTFSARFTTWNQVEKARTRSRARCGGRPWTRAISSALASASPSRRRMAATRSCSTRSSSSGPPCSSRISPTSAPSACTSSRSASCCGGKWIWLRITGARILLPATFASFGEILALRPHDAEALAGGGFHHPPALERCTRFAPSFSSRLHFGLDVVASRCPGARGWGAPPSALRRAARSPVSKFGRSGIVRLDLSAHSPAPASRTWRRRRDRPCLAVDDESGESALVHGRLLH